ncbi:MAG TPA: hypothetical protein VJ696_06125 [Rhodanobacteraceae bacterium]|nr:hypothetical protein [Rhodanobacteraceae bacterium]
MTMPIRKLFVFTLSIAFLPLRGIGVAQAQHSPLSDAHIPVEPLVARPLDPPPHFAGPETLTPPFGLQIVNASNVVHTSTFKPDGVLVAHNPSVIFNFPITPDIGAYLNGGLHFAYKAIGWVGHIYTEACLTDEEAPLWPSRMPKGADSATCPSKADTATQTFTPRQWYQVADAKADLYVVQNQGFVLIPTATPVNVQQIVTPLRFHLSGYTYYYSGNHTGPNDLNAACAGVACGPRLADNYTPPFSLVVAPAALVQIKALPETIVYLPPGDRSSGIFKMTKTFSTTITAGETVGVDNSNVRDDWAELVSSGGFNGDIGKVLDLGFNATTDTRWDTKTTIKAGQSLERDLQGVNQTATAFTHTITADHTTIPGADGPFEKQPFWGDLVVILVHPQLAVWDFYGRPIVQQFAASSAAGLPNDIAITVGELDACANGAAPFQNGYAFTTASQEPEVLTADECRNLAALDPFWGKGQSADLTGRGQLMVASQEYGIPVVGPQTENSLDIQTITSDAETVTNTDTVTYASTVESILATSWSAGITFGLNTGSVFSPFNFGLSDSVTLKAGESVDTAMTMSLNYKNSSATTFREDIQTEGRIDDDTNRGYSPHVEVYRDDIFGSLVFRDPDATCSPLPECRSVAPLGPSTQVPRRRHVVTRPPVHPDHATTH